jgi:Meiotically up-regulated gene 113
VSVYFAQLTARGLIKIGCSTNVKHRLWALNSTYREPLALLHVMPGDHETERQTHERFAHLRIKLLDCRDRWHWTEWFWPGLELMAFIDMPIFAIARPDGQELVVDSYHRAREREQKARRKARRLARKEAGQ